MPRPDELDHSWTKCSGAPDYEERREFYRNDPPLPRQTQADTGARFWAAVFIIAWLCVCAWLAAPGILSAEAAVNGCEAYRAEIVACAEELGQ